MGYEYDESYYNLIGSGTLLAVDSNYMDFSGLQFNTDSEAEDAVSLEGQRITMQNTIVRGGRYGIYANDPNLWLGIRNVIAYDSATGFDAELKLRAIVDLDRFYMKKEYCPLLKNADFAVQLKLPDEYDPD